MDSTVPDYDEADPIPELAPGFMRVAFTQYLLPDGEQADQWVDVPEELGALAAVVLGDDRVRRFAAEVLTNGIVSFTLELTDREEADPVNILVVNGPKVTGAIEDLIRKSHAWVTG